MPVNRLPVPWGWMLPGSRYLSLSTRRFWASLAGSFYAHYLNFINPATFDLFFSIKLLIMIALGGMHNIWGAIVGTGLITFLSNEWLQYFEEFEVIVYGAILLFVTVILPEGLAGVPGIVKGWFRR